MRRVPKKGSRIRCEGEAGMVMMMRASRRASQRARKEQRQKKGCTQHLDNGKCSSIAKCDTRMQPDADLIAESIARMSRQRLSGKAMRRARMRSGRARQAGKGRLGWHATARCDSARLESLCMRARKAGRLAALLASLVRLHLGN